MVHSVYGSSQRSRSTDAACRWETASNASSVSRASTRQGGWGSEMYRRAPSPSGGGAHHHVSPSPHRTLHPGKGALHVHNDPPPYGLSTQREEVSVLRVAKKRATPPELLRSERRREAKGSGQQLVGMDSPTAAAREVERARERKRQEEYASRLAARERDLKMAREEQEDQQRMREARQRAQESQRQVLEEQVRMRRDRDELLHASDQACPANSLPIIPAVLQTEERTAKRRVDPPAAFTAAQHADDRVPAKRQLTRAHEFVSEQRTPSHSPCRRLYPQQQPTSTPFDTYEANPSYPEPGRTGERQKFTHAQKAMRHRYDAVHNTQLDRQRIANDTSAQCGMSPPHHNVGRRTNDRHLEHTVEIVSGEVQRQSRFSRRPAPHEKVQHAMPQKTEVRGRRRSHSSDINSTRPW